MANFNPVGRTLVAPLCLEMCDRQGRCHKNLARAPARGSEAYEGASARSGGAGTIGLMLKSYETWGCRKGYVASLGVPISPRYPRWRRPW